MSRKTIRIIIIQLCIAAFALISGFPYALSEVQLSSYFSSYAELENNYGAYTSEWPLEAKTQLIRLMLEQGLLPLQNVEARQILYNDLSEDEKDRLASKLIETYYKDALSMDTYNIMLTELGQSQEWSYEAKALYSSLLVQYGKQKAGWDLFILPTEQDISCDTAKEIAIHILTEKFAVSEDVLAQSDISAAFFYKGGETLNSEPVWLIEFENIQQYGGRYCVEMSRQGEIITYKAPGSLPYSENEDILSDAVFAVPGAYDVSAEEIISIVHHAVGELGDYSQADVEMMEMKAYFLYHKRFSYGWEPVWVIYIYQENSLAFKALYAYDGTYIDLVTADMEFTNTIRNGCFTAGQGESFIDLGFWNMSLEEKAQFSEKWIPLVNAYLAQNPYAPYPNDLFYYATRYVYGIPSGDDITQEDAIHLAKQATVALGATPETLDRRPVECLFDITDPQKPLWKIVVSSAEVNRTEYVTNQNWARYRVVIDAKTGVVEEVWEIQPEMDVILWRF